ncbi:hypothetical protein FPANT_13482 [Fusarium pseudoanthophilum]|uniref:Uncharacterized protein n=1 Tax=Fusarium pseudoanthophilum TaxID=48495 RepID=A0A8H5KDD8_9HYPO|nr:hypothetical protein FPANT_13482 [Fusarium pseudoanthophilum]
MSTTTSESSSEHGEPARKLFGADPNSRSYAPEMDNLKKSGLYPMRCNPGWGVKSFLYYQGFSFEGPKKQGKIFFLEDFEEAQEFVSRLSDDRIHILTTTPPALCFGAPDIRELCQSLNFAPWISWGWDHYVLMGLGRRLYSPYYDIWFTIPLVELGNEEQAYADIDIDTLHVHSDEKVDVNLYGTVGMFYLSFNSETHQSRILHTSAGNIDEKLADACRQGPSFGITDDPFTLVTYFISKLEDYSNSLKFEITEDEETKVKETAIRLRKFLPYMEKISESVECMSQIIEDTISEHKDCRELLSIPEQHFRRVEKNLQTLRSKAVYFKTYQNSRIRRINVCLATLSSLLSLRADSAIKASTEAMTRLTEANREDSGRMNEIAIATKLDSEAMITIAKLTMFYLPSTFVATLFSMGIFNFDFDNGKNGRLVMSSQWWMYIIFAIPLTLGTFYWFRAVTRSHKQASQKAEREAKQPE